MNKTTVNDYINNNISEDSKFSYPEVSNAIQALLNHEDGYPWVNEFENDLLKEWELIMQSHVIRNIWTSCCFIRSWII